MIRRRRAPSARTLEVGFAQHPLVVRAHEELAWSLAWLGARPSLAADRADTAADVVVEADPERHRRGGWLVHDRSTGATGRASFDEAGDAIVDAWARASRLAVARDPRALLHAGLVAGPHGAVLVVGPARAGKSTMVAALVGAGLVALSDEMVAVGADGAVDPFGRPRFERDDGAGAPSSGSATMRSVAKVLAPVVPASAVALRAIVVLDRDDGPQRPALEPLSEATVARHLIANSFNLRPPQADRLDAVVALAARTPGWRLRYRDAPDAVAVVEPCWASAPTTRVAPAAEAIPHRLGQTWRFAGSTLVLDGTGAQALSLVTDGDADLPIDDVRAAADRAFGSQGW